MIVATARLNDKTGVVLNSIRCGIMSACYGVRKVLKR